jgi:hypothetical protein
LRLQVTNASINFPMRVTGRKLRRVTRCTRCYLWRRLDAGTDWNEGKIAITDNAAQQVCYIK